MNKRTICALVVCFLATGCGALPDHAGIYATHASVPFRGAGSAPVGDHRGSPETNWEAIEGTVTWDIGQWRVQSSMSYVVHSNNLVAPDGFLFGCRVGREISLTR